MTCSSRSTSAVGPEAMSRPKSSTAVVAQHADTRLMSWSTRIDERAGLLGDAPDQLRPRCSVSSSGRPAAGSSSSTSRACRRRPGRPRRAAAGRRRACRPGGRRRARARRTRPRRSTSWRRVARSPPVCSWTSSTLSNTDRLAIACSVWNVRRRPQRGPPEVGHRQQVVAEGRDGPADRAGRTR